MKKCLTCEELKVLTEFGKDKHKKDGLNPYCKVCIRARSAIQRKENPEYHLNYASQYRKENREFLRKKAKETFWIDREKRLEQSKRCYYRNKDEIAKRRKIKRSSPESRKKEALRQKEWRNRNKEIYGKYIRDWQKRNREKINAHAKVHTAVKNGTLKRSLYCHECKTQKGKMEGHHKDYSRPLDVIWLCRKCHASLLEVIEV
jgi:hypothetical protein